MASNYVQPGDTLTLTAPADGVVSGVPVQIGQLFVVPAVTADEGAPFAGHTRGVWRLPKAGSEAWTAGQLVYWDAASGQVTNMATGLRVGVAAADVGGGPDETTGLVRLDGVARPNEP